MKSNADSGVLSILRLMYREYADEYKKLARTTSDELQRALYLKMINIWEHAAIRFESGLETSGLTSERDQAEGDQEP